MVTFYMTILRILIALYRALHDEEFRALAFVAFALLLSGTIFYAHHEHWRYVDAFYFCVMTMTTIGFGDLNPTTAPPTTDLSKIFTILYAFITVGVFVSLAAKLATALISSGHKTSRHWKKG